MDGLPEGSVGSEAWCAGRKILEDSASILRGWQEGLVYVCSWAVDGVTGECFMGHFVWKRFRAGLLERSGSIGWRDSGKGRTGGFLFQAARNYITGRNCL